jgi:hypothetical protein
MGGVAVDHTPTRSPSLRKMSAAAGTMKAGPAGGVLKWTWASEPGSSSPARVVHVDFYQQGSAGGIDGVRGANQRALIDFARVLGKGEVDFSAALDVLE